MDDDQLIPLTPLRERTITFQGREIQTADLPDNQGYIGFYSLCDAFGLQRRGQRQRLQRQMGFYRPYVANVVMTTAGGAQPTLCLVAAAVPLFLTGVEVDRVKDADSRELLRAFLEEAMDVLAEHFGITERGEMRFLRESVARMVAEQEAYDERIENLEKKVEGELVAIRQQHETKVQQIRDAFAALRTDVHTVAGPHQRLTPEQLGQLKQTVNRLGTLLQQQGIPKPYPGIYDDVFRLTGVARSEHIRQADFPKVLTFLDQQIDALSRQGGAE